MNYAQKTLAGLFLAAATLLSPATASAVPVSQYVDALRANDGRSTQMLDQALLEAYNGMRSHLIDKANDTTLSAEKRDNYLALEKKLDAAFQNMDSGNIGRYIAQNVGVKQDVDLSDVMRAYLTDALKKSVAIQTAQAQTPSAQPGGQ